MVTLKECKEKLSIFKQHSGESFGIVKLGIFGSVARGENTDESDVDIVVEIRNPTLLLMFELHKALEKLLRCNVDLIRLRNTLRPMLLDNINREAVYV